jgi:hypothetical protein
VLPILKQAQFCTSVVQVFWMHLVSMVHSSAGASSREARLAAGWLYQCCSGLQQLVHIGFCSVPSQFVTSSTCLASLLLLLLCFPSAVL